MARIAKVNGTSNRFCTVHLNRELGEFTVKLWIGGKHYEPADYFTSHRADAMGTAREMANFAGCEVAA